MLFHNRPVKAAMGSVIGNGGVQLIGGKSLVKPKLATLHFGAEWRWAGCSEFEAEWRSFSESESVHSSYNLFCRGPVKWFRSAILINGDLAFAKGISGSKKKWRWGLPQCGPGLQGWELKLATQDCLVMREYLYWIWTWFIMLQYRSLVLLCIIYSDQQLESGCSIVYNWHDIIGGEDDKWFLVLASCDHGMGILQSQS